MKRLTCTVDILTDLPVIHVDYNPNTQEPRFVTIAWCGETLWRSSVAAIDNKDILDELETLVADECAEDA